MSTATTYANSFSCSLFRISKLRERARVSPSGTWLLESTPQHGLQRIGFVAAFSFIIARLNHGKPFLPWDDPFNLAEKFFFSSSAPAPVHHWMRKLLVVYPCVYYITLGRIWHFFSGIALYLFPEDSRCLLIASIMPSSLSGISCFSLSYSSFDRNKFLYLPKAYFPDIFLMSIFLIYS